MKTFKEYMAENLDEGAMLNSVARVLGWGSISIGLIQIVIGVATGDPAFSFGGVLPAAIGSVALNTTPSNSPESMPVAKLAPPLKRKPPSLPKMESMGSTSDPVTIAQNKMVQQQAAKMGLTPDQVQGAVAQILKVARMFGLVK